MEELGESDVAAAGPDLGLDGVDLSSSWDKRGSSIGVHGSCTIGLPSSALDPCTGMVQSATRS